MSADLLRRLIEAGTPAALVAEVADELADARAAERLLEKRRQADRERKPVRNPRIPRKSNEAEEFRNGAKMVPPIEELLTPSEDSPSDAIASLPPRQPVSEAFAIFSEAAAAVGWKVPSKLSPARSKTLGNRLREHGLDGWRACIARARASPYLAGADPPTWFTFDWLTKSGNFLKVTEGNYDRRHSDNSDPTAVALQRLHAFTGSVGAGG